MSSSPFKPPPFMKQQSRQLMMSLKKGREEMDVDELGDLDITTILGSEIDDQPISQEDQDRVKEALMKGLDLREYSHSVETELNQLDKLTIADYFSESENFLILYKQISVVDDTLQSVENMLNHFYNDIKNIGSEMNILQEKSMLMNYKVNNRKLLKEKLYEFIDVITIDTAFANHLTKGEINMEYVNCLMSLDQKITLFDDYKVLAPGICQNNEPQLSKLTVASIQKIQKFLRDSLSSFKKLSDRRQVQLHLAKMSYLFQFLFKYSQYIAGEVINTYVENSEKYYSNYYRNYTNSLLKMQDDAPMRSDVSNKLKTLFSSPTDSNHSINLTTLLSIASPTNASRTVVSRTEQLSKECLESAAIEPPVSASFWDAVPVIISSTTSSNIPSVKYPFEQVYRSLVYFLMEIITNETQFINEFFLGGEDMISTIFSRSIALLIETTEGYLSNSNDLISISIVIGILNNFKYVMTHEKNIIVLNELLFDKLIPTALERYQKVLKKHIDLLNSVSVKDLKPINFLHPHSIAKRYAEFHVCLSALHTLLQQNFQSQLQQQLDAIESEHKELQALDKKQRDKHYDDKVQALEVKHLKKKSHLQSLNQHRELIAKSMIQLRDYTLQLLRKLSNEISAKPDQVVFMVNNYSIVLQIWRESKLSGNDQSLGHFLALFNSSTSKYIEDQLAALRYFTAMTSFVNEWGPLVESNVKIDPSMNPSFNAEAVERIFEAFENNWKSAVAVIKDNSIKHFSTSAVAKNRTFDALLTQIYENYRTMVIIVTTSFPQLTNSSKHYRPTQFLQDIRAMAPKSKFDDFQTSR